MNNKIDVTGAVEILQAIIDGYESCGEVVDYTASRMQDLAKQAIEKLSAASSPTLSNRTKPAPPMYVTEHRERPGLWRIGVWHDELLYRSKKEAIAKTWVQYDQAHAVAVPTETLSDAAAARLADEFAAWLDADDRNAAPVMSLRKFLDVRKTKGVR